MTPQEQIAITSGLAQSVASNLFMAQRQSIAQKDLSLREKSYAEGIRQADRNYEMEGRRLEMTGKYQDAQMQAWNRQALDFETDTTVAPIVADFASQLDNLHGDPDAIEKWSPDMSVIDQAPENIRARMRAKLSMAGRELRDKALASSTEYKDRSERGALLLKGSKYLTPDNGFTDEARGVSEMIGRKLLRRERLTPEEEMMAASLASKVEKEVQKRDPDLVKARYKYGTELTIEGLKTATIEFNEASKSLRDARANPVIPKVVLQQLEEERNMAATKLQIAKKTAGISDKLPGENDDEETDQKTKQEDKTKKSGVTPEAKQESPLKRALKPYPGIPSKAVPSKPSSSRLFPEPLDSTGYKSVEA
jgi:hypothetical protein